MSEKIILSVEQNERIEDFLSVATTRGFILSQHVKGWTDCDNLSLNKLSVDQMARILYEPNSYEVEKPKFEVGDWAVRVKCFDNVMEFFDGKKPFEIFKLVNHMAVDKNDRNHNVNFIRHATKEEIFWASNGREVGEFKIGDGYVYNDFNMFIINNNRMLDDARVAFVTGALKGFFPCDSYRPIPTP